MKHRAVLMSTAIALILAQKSIAAERTLTLLPEETEVSFSLAATGKNVHGSFQLSAGEIRFDADTGKASGRIDIDARAAQTGNRKRDKKMHKKVLESEQFALIRFTPESIEGTLAPTGASDITLHGTVTILGQEHPLDLLAHVEVDGTRLKIQGELEVPYVEWGMHDPSILILRVAKIVKVSITAVGSLSGGDVDARSTCPPNLRSNASCLLEPHPSEGSAAVLLSRPLDLVEYVMFLFKNQLALTKDPAFADNLLYWLLEDPR